MGKDKLANLALSGNGFLFDAQTGHTYTLNKTGAFILKSLIDGVGSADLVEKLAEQFDVSVEVAARDLDQFMTRLHSLDLLPDWRSSNAPRV